MFLLINYFNGDRLNENFPAGAGNGYKHGNADPQTITLSLSLRIPMHNPETGICGDTRKNLPLSALQPDYL